MFVPDNLAGKLRNWFQAIHWQYLEKMDVSFHIPRKQYLVLEKKLFVSCNGWGKEGR